MKVFEHVLLLLAMIVYSLFMLSQGTDIRQESFEKVLERHDVAKLINEVEQCEKQQVRTKKCRFALTLEVFDNE